MQIRIQGDSHERKNKEISFLASGSPLQRAGTWNSYVNGQEEIFLLIYEKNTVCIFFN
jgi:hypothetical protein